MDALSRLLGDERRSLGDGVYLRRAPASAYLRAYRAREAAGEGTDGNVLFVAHLIAGGLEDEAGALFFKNGDEALDRLPIEFIIRTSSVVTEVNGLGDDEDTEGKSERAP